MDEEFKSEILDKLDMITKALTRLAEAQTIRSMTEFCKLSPEQREDYYAGLEDIRKHGWNSLFEENRVEVSQDELLKQCREIIDRVEVSQDELLKQCEELMFGND